MKIKAEVAAYSSVVGGGVLLRNDKGQMIGQVAFLCHTDDLRDKGTQLRLSKIIADAINDAGRAALAAHEESEK